MMPSLARRGKLVLGAGVWFVLIGALYGAPPLVALGAVVTCAIMSAYLWFFPIAILLRRQKIELSWWIPPGDQPGAALSVDRPFAVRLALRNHGHRALRVLEIRIVANSAIEVPDDLEAVVPAGQQVELAAEVRCHSAGYQVLHGAAMVFGDILGLFEVRAFFPNPIATKVFPRQLSVRSSLALRPQGGSLHERVGLHFVRRRGLAGELREIREHTHGDPFKFIAWKPTARRQKLMVREHETEIVVTHQILVDIAGTMRNGASGTTKLDYAIDSATALAKTALDNGDRVGLVTFDTRVFSALKSGDGHHHYLKIIDRLIETHNVVDEDLTDVTHGELVAAVAAYLAHQEAVDVRLRTTPDLDDPKWERIQAGPNGELYDLGTTDTLAKSILKSMGSKATKNVAPTWWWSRAQVAPDTDPRLMRLRLFCRLRGIELPYRRQHETGKRVEGLRQAIETAIGKSRADLLVVYSDLAGVIEDPKGALRALARGRQGGRSVVVVAPFEPSFAPAPMSDQATIVASVLADDQRRQFDEAKRLVASRGISVIEAGPRDHIGALLSRMSRSRNRAA